jgi:hypothetical protein
MRAQISSRDYEVLSAYMDGQLAAGEQRRLEQRLQALPELQAALEELRQTRTLLRQAPRHRAPRNFTLTPAMVADVKRERRAPLFWFPVLSFTSAVAALALIVIIAVQLAPRGTPANQSVAMQPAAEPQSKAAPTQVAALAPSAVAPEAGTAMSAPADQGARQVPPMIVWGNTGNNQTVTGRGGGGGDNTVAGSTSALLGPPASAALPAPGGFGMGGGGGGSDSPYSVPSNTIIIPPQSVQSLEGTVPKSSAQAAQPNAQITGTGPILGVPPASAGGQIVSQNAILGNPVPGAAAAEQPSLVQDNQPREAVPAAQGPLGLNPGVLYILEWMLGVVAVIAAVAAFFIRRRQRG